MAHYLKNLITGEGILINDGMVFGRPADPDEAKMANFDSKISRRHFKIQILENEEVYLVDLGPTNGTSVNHKKVKPHSKTKLSDGDVVNFGSQVLIYEFLNADEEKQKISSGDRSYTVSVQTSGSFQCFKDENSHQEVLHNIKGEGENISLEKEKVTPEGSGSVDFPPSFDKALNTKSREEASLLQITAERKIEDEKIKAQQVQAELAALKKIKAKKVEDVLENTTFEKPVLQKISTKKEVNEEKEKGLSPKESLELDLKKANEAEAEEPPADFKATENQVSRQELKSEEPASKVNSFDKFSSSKQETGLKSAPSKEIEEELLDEKESKEKELRATKKFFQFKPFAKKMNGENEASQKSSSKKPAFKDKFKPRFLGYGVILLVLLGYGVIKGGEMSKDSRRANQRAIASSEYPNFKISEHKNLQEACSKGSVLSCYSAGLLFQHEGNAEMAVRYYQMACDAQMNSACTLISK